jgi:hypothetical protein
MTYEIKTKSAFAELSKEEQKQVIEFLHESIAMDLQVSVQAQTVETSDDDYVTLYGLYANDDEWVSNYYSNGGMWSYHSPAQLLNNFTDGNDADFKFYGISDNLEFEDTPVIFYGSFNHLQPLIDKARQALIDLNADRVQFYYRSEILNGKEIFLNSENLDDVFDIDNDSDISWLAPELAVSIHDTKIVWQDKHDSTNEMWITIERAYGTNFQAIHDRAVNHDSKLA